jgi:HEAT repeat protein
MIRTVYALTAVAIAAAAVPAQAPTVAELRKQLRGRDPIARLAAATALAERGSEAAPAAKALADALGDPAPEVRTAAADALAAIGPTAARLVRTALRDHDRQLAAVRAAGGLGDAAMPMLPDVTKLWQNGELPEREAVDAALLRLGPRVVPHLAELVPHHMFGIRAADILGKLGPDARAAVPALIAVLEEGVQLGDPYAVDALGAIGDPRAIPVLTSLVEAGGGKDFFRDGLAVKAVRALAGFGDAAAPALPAILKLYLDEDLDEAHGHPRRQIAHALEQLGIASEAVVAALRHYADQADPVGEAARRALAALVPDGSVPLDQLKDIVRHHRRVPVRLRALDAIAARPAAPDVVDALAAAAKSNSAREVRLAALVALEAAGPAADGARSTLGELAADDDEEIAAAARRALERIDGGDPA